MRLYLGEPPHHRRRVESPRTSWTGRARGRAPISVAAREQLADACVSQWAYITSVDGDSIRSVPELQKALRQRSIGEEARLRVEENGHSREIVVRHLSDID